VQTATPSFWSINGEPPIDPSSTSGKPMVDP
jgi:hypothetical protein